MAEEVSREEVIAGLKKAKFKIYPVVVEKGTMQILDGISRKQADPTWFEREVEIKDPKDRILIPMHANYRRHIPRKETEAQILRLAEMLLSEGTSLHDLILKLTEITPFSEQWIRKLLPSKYKQEEKARTVMPEFRITPAAMETQIPSIAPAEEIIQGPVCPSCQSEIQTVLCPRCLKEISFKDLKGQRHEG